MAKPEALLIVLLILIPASYAQDENPRDQLVLDFLLLGDIAGWPNHLGEDEPAVDLTLVPCRAFGQDVSDEYLHRWSRIYFPRTPDDLLEFDVLFFNHPRLDFFTMAQQEMMVDFTGTENRTAIAYPLSHYDDVQQPWLASPISEAIPIDFEQFVTACKHGWGQWDGPARLRLQPGMPPVFSTFEETGTFSSRIYEQFRPAIPREGAKVWVHGLDGPPRMPEAPAFVSWPYGDTESWGFGIHPGTGDLHFKRKGKWWELIFLNICYYTTREDTMQYDEALEKFVVKDLFRVYRETSSMYHRMADFVDKFGANTEKAERTFQKGDELRDQADIHYLSMEYESARIRMGNALDIARQGMEEANQAKDRALFWIYISQWMATTATIFLSGAALWWLMVRRGLYREVATTQLDQE